MQSTPSRFPRTRSRSSLTVPPILDSARSRSVTIPTLFLALSALLALPAAIHAQGLTVGSGPLTVEELPTETSEDLPVCADSSTGKLGPCSESGADISRIAWVAQDGTGDYADPVAALKDAPTWCGIPSATNLCVLKIGPGVYELSQALELAEWITVEGSGLERTVLTRDGQNVYTEATVETSGTPSDTRLRDLTVEATSGSVNLGILAAHTAGVLTVENVLIRALDDPMNGESMGLRSTGSGSVILRDVEIEAFSVGIATGISQLDGGTRGDRVEITVAAETDDAIGIDDDGNVLRFENTAISVFAKASNTDGDGLRLTVDTSGVVHFSGLQIETFPIDDGKGIFVDTGDTSPIVPVFRNIVIDASYSGGNSNYGVYTQNGADLRITGSTIHGDTAALFASGTASTQTVAHSILDGSASGSIGAYTCASVFDHAALASLDSQCQTGL